jgi:tetratricopeptide (TPR) repeat protein
MESSSFFNADILNNLSQQAIAAAIKGQWQNAVAINSEILNKSPKNTEALNRLGKSYMELGLIVKSIKTFQICLNISPNNPIALKNLQRLQSLEAFNQKTVKHMPSTPHDFIEDSKTVTTNLINLTSADHNLKVSPGHKCDIEITNNTVTVLDSDKVQIGQIEPRLGSRIIRLIKCGNEFISTVKSSASNKITIIIRESFTPSPNKSISSFQNKRIRKLPDSNNLDGEIDIENESPLQINTWSDDDDFEEDDQFRPEIHRIIDPESEKTS